MKHLFSKGFAMFLMAAAVGAIPSLAVAVPGQFNVQGVLRDAAGNLMDGELTVTLRIYLDQEATQLLWEEERTVSLAQGVFDLLVPGDPEVNPFPEGIFADGDILWLSMQAAGHEELPPMPLVSVP